MDDVVQACDDVGRSCDVISDVGRVDVISDVGRVVDVMIMLWTTLETFLLLCYPPRHRRVRFFK